MQCSLTWASRYTARDAALTDYTVLGRETLWQLSTAHQQTDADLAVELEVFSDLWHKQGRLFGQSISISQAFTDPGRFH